MKKIMGALLALGLLMGMLLAGPAQADDQTFTLEESTSEATPTQEDLNEVQDDPVVEGGEEEVVTAPPEQTAEAQTGNCSAEKIKGGDWISNGGYYRYRGVVGFKSCSGFDRVQWVKTVVQKQSISCEDGEKFGLNGEKIGGFSPAYTQNYRCRGADLKTKTWYDINGSKVYPGDSRDRRCYTAMIRFQVGGSPLPWQTARKVCLSPSSPV